MYKLGCGNGKRPIAPPSSAPRRPPSAAPRGRLSMGGSSAAQNRPQTSAAAQREEHFRLESERPLDFAAIVKLTPDLVEEIRRFESEGGFARIKFDPSLKNQTRNVIDVGGKEFKFTWSKDSGDLCEIYEERQSREDGNGLLVECGSSWRKLNVHRNLDESTKNNVKMVYEEAHRLSQSRKPIVLDPTNPSMKSQVNSMAAAGVEGNMRRMGWKNNQEFFKKRKTETNQVSNIGPPKYVSKTGTSIKNSKGRPYLSPNPSPSEYNHPGTSTSPFGTGTSYRDDSSYNPIASLNMNKEDTRKSDKNTPIRVINAVQNNSSCRAVGVGEQIEKLRSMLITTLSDNPKGTSLKDLEKAIGGTIPNCGRKILSIIKEVANPGASGMYLLKPHLRKVSEGGSSPECLDDHAALLETVRTEKTTNLKSQRQSSSSLYLEEEPDCDEKIDRAQNNEEPFATEGKSNNDGEDRAFSSSQSESDSDSDSSDSASDSGSQSRSRSRSPVRSGSRSSSDSDSDTDGSSSSKEGSDVDVDILSDDEKDIVAHKAVAPEPYPSPLPSLSKYANEQSNFSEDQHMHVSSSSIDLNNFQYDEGTNVAETNKELPVSGENFAFENPKIKTSNNVMMNVYNKTSRVQKAASLRSPNHERHVESQQLYHDHSAIDVNEPVQKSSFSNKHSMLKDKSEQVLHETSVRISKSKSKRPSSSDHFKGKPGGNKRPKSTSSAQDLFFGKNKEHSSLGTIQPNITGRYEQDSSQDNEMRTSGTVDLEGFRTDSWDISPAMHVKNASSEIPHKVQQSPFFQSGSGVDVEQSAYGSGDFNSWKKDLENTDRLDGSYRREYGELGRMSVDSGLHWGRKKSVAKGSILSRELSDLELGELRETSGAEEYQGVEGKVDRKGSCRSLQTTIPSNLDLGISKGRTSTNIPPESKKRSPVTSNDANQRKDLNQRKPPKDILLGPETTTHTQVRPLLSMNEQFANVDHVGSVSVLAVDKPIEKCRNVGQSSQGVTLENNVGAQKKISADMLRQSDNMPASEMVCKNTKELEAHKSILQRDSTGQDREEIFVVNDIDHMRGSDPPSNEDNFLYLKYDKDKPELKGAIKDLSQYKEYVEECHEKYEIYYSLNTNLENIRNNFLQVGRDLEIAEGRDMEKYLRALEKLKKMYQQCSEKNKKMKRVFMLLHDELKNLKQRIKDFAESFTN